MLQWHCCGRRGTAACSSRLTAVCFSGQVFRIVSTCLGSPPETFCWEFRDKEKNYHKYGPMTPVQFYNEHVKPYFNMEDKVGDAENFPRPSFLLLSHLFHLFSTVATVCLLCSCSTWGGHSWPKSVCLFSLLCCLCFTLQLSGILCCSPRWFCNGKICNDLISCNRS